MRLEDYAIEARKRTEWEVLDLGTLMFQANLACILRSSLLLGIPILMVTGGVVVTAGFFWGYLVLWLLRPIYGRVTLFVLSRAVFSSHPSPREIARALPGFLFKGFFTALLICPWTLSRVIMEPVRLLEGLAGKGLRRRSQVLLGEGVRASVWWGAVSVALVQICLLFSIFVLIDGFMPEGIVDWEGEGTVDNPSTLVAWLGLITVALSFAVVEPLWVATGFAMYLNRRSDLEGWDVELVFRRLARRASQGVRLSGISLVALLACFPTRWILLGQSEESAERPVDRVFARDEFITTKTRLVESGGMNAPGWLGGLFEVLVWFGLVALVLGLLYVLVRWAMGMEPPELRGKKEEEQGVQEVAGLDLRRESLPRDVVAEARVLWTAGDAKGALSLLYRGSLVVLRDEHGLVIEDGDTEGRCLRKVVRLEVMELGTYFGGLTRQWTRLAYGGERVDPDSFVGLADGYGLHFGGGQ